MSDTSSVYIFDTWTATPVYHGYGRIDKAKDADVTVCGLVMYDGETRYRVVIRRDHADRFAKPCGKCFRAAASSADTRKEQSE